MDKLTVGEMKEKIDVECNKRIDCVGCPLYPESDEPCFADDDKAIKKNYAIMFNRTIDAPSHCNNAVDHPAHYCYSKYEPKDVIRGWGLNFNLGSAVKYIARAGRKDDIIQDLEKAKKFLEFEIEALKLDRENGSDV